MMTWASAKFIGTLFGLIWVFRGKQALIAPLHPVQKARIFESDSFYPTIDVPHDSHLNSRFSVKLFLCYRAYEVICGTLSSCFEISKCGNQPKILRLPQTKCADSSEGKNTQHGAYCRNRRSGLCRCWVT